MSRICSVTWFIDWSAVSQEVDLEGSWRCFGFILLPQTQWICELNLPQHYGDRFMGSLHRTTHGTTIQYAIFTEASGRGRVDQFSSSRQHLKSSSIRRIYLLTLYNSSGFGTDGEGCTCAIHIDHRQMLQQ